MKHFFLQEIKGAFPATTPPLLPNKTALQKMNIMALKWTRGKQGPQVHNKNMGPQTMNMWLLEINGGTSLFMNIEAKNEPAGHSWNL